MDYPKIKKNHLHDGKRFFVDDKVYLSLPSAGPAQRPLPDQVQRVFLRFAGFTSGKPPLSESFAVIILELPLSVKNINAFLSMFRIPSLWNPVDAGRPGCTIIMIQDKSG
jgi:hypothetical protein